MEFDREKFKAIVHYICHKAEKKDLGSTKLNKILWYTDSLNYLYNGESVTGETYTKQKHGPVPHHMLSVRDELEACGFIICESSEYHGYTKTDYNCLQEPSTDSLTDQEIELVDQLTDIICKKHSAVSISESTHDWLWEIADLGEEIPLCAAFVSKIKKPSEAARNWAFSALTK